MVHLLNKISQLLIGPRNSGSSCKYSYAFQHICIESVVLSYTITLRISTYTFHLHFNLIVFIEINLLLGKLTTVEIKLNVKLVPTNKILYNLINKYFKYIRVLELDL